jgi:hypothetical protein
MKVAVVIVAIALVTGCATGAPPAVPRPAETGARSPGADPTHGRLINTTSWTLSVWIDHATVNGRAPASVTLQPGDAVPWTLGQGQHRVVAHARTVGQPDGPVVARFDRTIALDPQRVDGWFLRFREADFR